MVFTDILTGLFLALGFRTEASHFWGCASAYMHDHILKFLLARYLTNRLWEFHQISNFVEVGDKDELIRF